MTRLEQDHDNLRAALTWSIAHAPAEVTLRFAAALSSFWLTRSYDREGRAWLEQALTASGAGGRTTARAAALQAGASLSRILGDPAEARRLLNESVAIWRDLGEPRGLATGLAWRALVEGMLDDHDAARVDAEAALATWSFDDDPWSRGEVLHYAGHVAQMADKPGEAERYFRESAVLLRLAGDEWSTAQLLMDLGTLASERGDYTDARPLLEESRALLRAAGDTGHFLRVNSVHLGLMALQTGELAQARAIFRDLVRQAREEGLASWEVFGLYGLTILHGRLGNWPLAARLVGALERTVEARHIAAPAITVRELQRLAVHLAREALGEEAFTAALAEGERLSLDEAVALACEGS